MTEYDIQRTAKAVVDLLLADDRFTRRMEKLTSRNRTRMVNSSKAADLLGISTDTLRDIAPYIGGIKKGSGQRSKWAFEENGLRDRYLEYMNNK